MTKKNEPYYITVLKNAQKHYPDYRWSTERRQLDGSWARTLTGRRGHFVLSIELPDKPTTINHGGHPAAYWRAATDVITTSINEGELKYGQMPAMDKQETTGETDLLLRSEDAGGDDDGQGVGKHQRSRPDSDGEPPEARG